jgi:hypothetical protein
VIVLAGMTATGWKGGKNKERMESTYGVSVGRTNARGFSKHWKAVELEIDGDFHEFPLRETFWTNCPEFRGAVIGQWLSRHGLAHWPHGKPPKLVLTPLGGNRFRLSV